MSHTQARSYFYMEPNVTNLILCHKDRYKIHLFVVAAVDHVLEGTLRLLGQEHFYLGIVKTSVSIW